jgi:hypothetical protein
MAGDPRFFAASFFAQLTAADKGSPPLGKRANFR